MLLNYLMRLAGQGSRSKVGVLALVLALLIVGNPELRALLLLAQSVGAEALLLLLCLQLRTMWPILRIRVAQSAGLQAMALASLLPREGLRIAIVHLVLLLTSGTRGLARGERR